MRCFRLTQPLAHRLRRLGRLRRVLLIARLRYAAWRERATVVIDIPPGVAVGRRILLEIGPGTTSRISVGPGSTLGDGLRLRLRGGEIRLGENVDVRGGCVLNVGGGTLVMEGPNNLSWGVTIHCAEAVHLARHAHVAEYSTIVDSTHYYTAEHEWSYHNTRTRPIALGEDVWVCPKATITSGVTIGDHTIVGSNSVVVRDAPSGVLLSGIPAVVVRALELPWRGPTDPPATT